MCMVYMVMLGLLLVNGYYQVPLRHILLIYDEMSLPNGVLRLPPKGGHGHHNGYAPLILLFTTLLVAEFVLAVFYASFICMCYGVLSLVCVYVVQF
ncbi:hypothetical protein V6Z12_D11G375700 [Gossypium hirsutum]